MAISKIENNSLASGVPGTANLPAGTVLQVVQGISNTQASTTSTTYQDTGLTASITPTSTTSKIFVVASYQAGTTYSGTNGGGFRLLRNSTTILDPNQYDGGGPYGFYVDANTSTWINQTIQYLDSPATTASTTYKIQMRTYQGTSAIYINGAPSVTTPGKSVITLMEIAA